MQHLNNCEHLLLDCILRRWVLDHCLYVGFFVLKNASTFNKLGTFNAISCINNLVYKRRIAMVTQWVLKLYHLHAAFL